MSGQATFSSGVANQSHHTQRIGGDGEEVGIERPIQVPLTVVANNQQAPNYEYEFDPSSHLMNNQFDEDPIPPNHQRSETIGSDTFVDDIPADNSTAKIGAATLCKPSHTHHSDSDVASDSVPQDLERERNLGRKEELSPPELKKRVRGNRYETRRNKYQIDDEESVDEDERKRDERDRDGRYWDRGRMHSESFREPERRDRGERYRNENHNDDWDNRSRNSARYYNRGYGDEFDDSISRPRSRNRYYGREHDDYYSRYRPHDRYNDFRRQEELELQYRIRRERLAESLMYNHNPTRANYNTMDVRRHMEDLRLRNPAVYRDWYNKYLAHMRNPTTIPFPSLPGYGAMPSLDTPSSFGSVTQDSYSNNPMDPEQRHFSISSERPPDSEMLPFGPGSHSNDSEVENFLKNPNFPSVIETPTRNTPLKFRNSHSFAVFTPQGQLMRIKGAAGTTVEISGVRQFYQHLPEVKELELFPGPLVKGSTHKNTLIQFCQRKIQEISLHKREGDNENFILLWEVLVLLLKHNGNVVGSDISELLLETTDKHDSCRDIHRLGAKIDTDGSEADDTSQSDSVEKKKDVGLVQPEKFTKDEITQQFCQLLLFGHRKDALDYAMNNDLWGHALFLSSKLDERTHSHVLTRFSAVLPANHPLQTLYQMLSGRQPSSVTNCIDDSYGDWRPHLAMILSNSGFRHEVENKAIISLGDTLGFKNQLFAAQFCYLMAQLEFSSNSKLGPLIGYTPQHKSVIEATQMTEIYEFAKSLADPNFSLGASFIERKLNYMNTLIDYGFLLEAYSYCEEIAKKLLNSNCDNIIHAAFTNLIQVGERLKHFCEDPSLVTPPWIIALKEKISWSSENGDIDFQIKGLTIADSQNGTEVAKSEDSIQQDLFVPNQLQFENTNAQQGEYPSNGAGLFQDPYTQSAQIGVYQNSNDAIDHGRTGSNELQITSNPNMFEMSSVPFHQSNSSSAISNQPSPYVSNNNYLYQPQPYDYDPPMGGNYGATSADSTNLNDKKKSVRFDEERLQNRSKINLSEKTSVELSKHRILDNKNTEIKSALKSKQNLRDDLGKVTPTPSLKFNHPDKEKVNLNSMTNSSNVKFNDTFPIDEPSSLRPSLPSTIANSFSSRIKTFPIDKKCCDVQQPCLEHDIYQSGNSASAAPCSCINPFDGYNNKMDNQTVHQFQQNNPASKGGSNSQPTKSKSTEKILGKPKADQTSWIGGLLSKLPTLKPKNQMILPDDKNPTIVWDPVKNDWINTKEDESETSVRAGPPPKDSDLRRPEDTFTHPINPPSIVNSAPNPMIGNSNVPVMNASVNSSFADPSSGSGPNVFNANGVNAMNKYKLPKGLRNNYVDVFNPGGGQTQKPISAVGGPGNGVMGVPSFFVPPSSITTPDLGPVSFLTAPTENPLIPEDSIQEGNYATN